MLLCNQRMVAPLSIGRRLNTFTSREESYLRPKLSSLRSSQSQKHGSKQ